MSIKEQKTKAPKVEDVSVYPDKLNVRAYTAGSADLSRMSLYLRISRSELKDLMGSFLEDAKEDRSYIGLDGRVHAHARLLSSKSGKMHLWLRVHHKPGLLNRVPEKNGQALTLVYNRTTGLYGSYESLEDRFFRNNNSERKPKSHPRVSLSSLSTTKEHLNNLIEAYQAKGGSLKVSVGRSNKISITAQVEEEI